jgi:hypothetical protein
MGLSAALALCAPAAGASVPTLSVARPAAQAALNVRREVIVLYNSAERVGLRGEGAPTAVEVILNHLGLIARFWDLQNGLPDAALAKRARGIVSLAEGDQAPGAEALARWLDARRLSGQPLMLLGGLPFMAEARTGAPVRAVLWRPILEGLGLHFGGEFLGDSSRITLAALGAGARFEMPWTADALPPYIQASVRAPARSLIRLRRRDTGATSDMAVVGPAGAVVLGRECLFDVNPLSFRVRWRLDPFVLFGTALQTKGEPHPDTTTVCGRRVFYAHIDGDGFSNLAQAHGQPLAAEIIRDRLLSQTPLPTSVSVIARDMVGHPRASAVARSIFALPNVEAATHTYNHPHDFELGTLTPIGAFSDGDRISGLRPSEPISPVREIDDSVRAIERLLPKGHRVELVLWSGSTNPTAPFLARVAALKLANLNGGDAMIDAVTPSVANLAPLGRQVGPYLQVYASAANENLFTNLWNGPFDGQRQVLSTFTFFGAPRRLAPVNIYYHFYSGERPASLLALRDLYAWAAARPLAYVQASHYARTVEGFYSAQIVNVGNGVWQASHMGACRTLRFDQEAGTPDMSECVAVAGFERAGQALYVHLAGPDARVVLTHTPGVHPFLVTANAPLMGWSVDGQRVNATFEAQAPCEVTLGGLPPNAAIHVADGWHGPKVSDSHGRLTLGAPRGRLNLEARW